mgnify:CR=1 FL=1
MKEKTKKYEVAEVEDESGARTGAGRLFARVMRKRGFDVDFSELKMPDVKPSHVWAGIKNAGTNSLNVFNNKVMAFDKPLFILVIVLLIVGVTMMSSASYAYALSMQGNSLYFINRQIIFALIGLILMVALSTVPPDFFKGKNAYIIAGISIALLLLVLFLPGKKGVHRWINLGITTFQPSELAKFAVIIVCATYIAYHYQEMNITTYKTLESKLKAAKNKRYRIRYDLTRNFQTAVWPFMWRVGIILALVLKEPHLSCTIIIMLITGTMMLLGGTRKLFFAVLLGVAFAAICLVIFTGAVPYAQARVDMWQNPFADAKGEGWQTVQSLYAISSGGLFGVGFGNSRQKFMYIAEPQNDFIFAVVCEELGLIGASVIILIFAVFIWRGFAISIANPDRFQKFLGIGITSQVGYQMILNIAVVSNLVPNTGISLPFFSYGGTSLVMLLAEMGVLLSISRSSPNKIK